MNLLESIRWDCIEWNDRRSLTVTNKIFNSEIGQQIILNGQKQSWKKDSKPNWVIWLHVKIPENFFKILDFFCFGSVKMSEN